MRPNGLAYVLPGEPLPNRPPGVNSETECQVLCMINPRCTFYNYFPLWQPADADIDDLPNSESATCCWKVHCCLCSVMATHVSRWFAVDYR